MKRRIIVGMMLLMSITIFAQNDVLLTQQWFSRINRNPAATGNSDNLDLFFLTRQQWVGVDNGPQTNLLNVHNYFDDIRSGLGLTMSYDQTGIAYSALNAKLDYAYHVNINENMLLSLGLGAGILEKTFDPTKQILQDPQELGMSTFPDQRESQTHPDFDFGFELSTPELLLGASITHLGDLRKNYTTFTAQQNQYLYARGNLALDPDFDLAPSIVYQNTGNINIVDLGAMLFYKKMYWVGLDYRSPTTMVAMLGVEWTMFRIGYSYDFSMGKLNNLASSTNELMLSLRISKGKKNKNVRFME
jgi:type IX secretion system PorP/SprF family membrane protein